MLNTTKLSFPVVGIGASTGGIESITDLVKEIPEGCGFALVLVQNLDPGHPGLALSVLRSVCKLPVENIVDGMKLEANKLFLLAPNSVVRLNKDRFSLIPQKTGHYHPMVIDTFFDSLAGEAGRRAIGVILSGMSCDGAQGLAAIKSQGGLSFVEDPSTASFKTMPQSCIDAQVADLILQPKAIAQEILRLKKSSAIIAESFSQDHAWLPQIFAMLHANSRTDLSQYKLATVKRRIQRRMMLQKLNSLEDYVRLMKTTPEEAKALHDDLLIHVTEFFRDAHSFKVIANSIFPTFITDRPLNRPIRIWVPGCSTGEEVYSIAISLLDFLQDKKVTFPVQIFGTDLSEQSVQTARQGRYPESATKNFTADQLQQYFEKINNGYRVRKFVRNLCIFSVHDMTQDPPFAKLDLISCRNVLIYFSPELQKRVLPIFHYALNPTGYLWLGRSESTGSSSKLFSIINKAHKIFAKANIPTPVQFLFPYTTYSTQPLPPISAEPLPISADKTDFQKEADKMVLSQFAPPGVITNSELEILQFRGRCAPFLEPPPLGLPSHNVLKMVRPELFPVLRNLFERVKKENILVSRKNLKLKIEGKKKIVSIDLTPINPSAAPSQRYYLLFFRELSHSEVSTVEANASVPKQKKNQSRDSRGQSFRELQQELHETQDSHLILVGQYEATQEELTAANEELQSANEELQCTNEELETAKEELLSANEELVTVNDTLQSRNNDLTTLGSDLNNLLDSTEIPILMVGNDLRIRRFTPKARFSFNVIASDIGRPLSDIKSSFKLDLSTLVKEVTDNLTPKELELQDEQGLWRRLQIRPYRSLDNKVDGAVITLIDIEDLKVREKHSREAMEYAMSITETVPFPLIVLDPSYQIKSVNNAFYKHFVVQEDLNGKNLFSYLNLSEKYQVPIKELINKALRTDTSFTDFEVRIDFPTIGQRRFLLSGRKIYWLGHAQDSVLISLVDVTEQRIIEEEIQASLARERDARGEAEKANQTKDIFLATLSHELRTPLSSILTWAHLISTGKVDSANVKRGATIIEQSATAQSQLIDDLLDISRIITGKLMIDMKPINLTSIIGAAVGSVQPMADKKNIDIKTQIISDEAYIFGDNIRVQQILWNLLTNAIKFSPNNSPIEIELECTQGPLSASLTQASVAQIKVKDHGKGIAADFLPKIFSRFTQADNATTRNHGGLGLGLSIAHSLVQLQGGTIEAENRSDGSGAIFTLRFPLQTANARLESSDHPSSLINQIEPHLKNYRILFVEDDLNTREAIELFLISLGATVKSVDSVSAALAVFKEFKPDLLLSDIAMPGENGYSLIQKIRQLPEAEGGNVVALALTAYASKEDAIRTLQAGFNAHVAKPVKDMDLAKAILRALNSSGKLKQ